MQADPQRQRHLLDSDCEAVAGRAWNTGEYEIVLEPIESLTRINHNSPYTKDNPIRKNTGIEPISAPRGYCGHSCVAMLAGVLLADVIDLMGKEKASWSKILEALDFYGISYADKMVYPKGNFKCKGANNNRIFETLNRSKRRQSRIRISDYKGSAAYISRQELEE